MNEKLLQYLWNFKIFKNFDFKDVEGNAVEILDFGTWNFNSGPDFLLGKIKTKNLVLAGNIELHVKSSDYIFHQHSGNPEFENLILHVVFIHDVEVEELNQHESIKLELVGKANLNEWNGITTPQIFIESYEIKEDNLLDF